MITSILSWVWIGSGVLLIVSVLLHSPKGDGMGGLASSGGSMFTSARSAEDTLNRISWTLLSIFLGLAVVLSAGWLKYGDEPPQPVGQLGIGICRAFGRCQGGLGRLQSR